MHGIATLRELILHGYNISRELKPAGSQRTCAPDFQEGGFVTTSTINFMNSEHDHITLNNLHIHNYYYL